MATRRIADDAQGRPRWVRQRYNANEFTVPAAYIPDLRAYNKGWSSISFLPSTMVPSTASRATEGSVATERSSNDSKVHMGG